MNGFNHYFNMLYDIHGYMLYIYISQVLCNMMFHDPRMGKNRTIYDIDNI